jgi:hypothetical protein
MYDATDIDGQNARARLQLIPERLAALLPRDGVLTFLLTLAIIYITVVSIQAVKPVWADGLGILTPAMLCGVGVGYIALKQHLIRGNLMHLLALIAGSLISFFLTANALLNGDRGQLFENLSIWIQRTLIKQQVSTDNSVFVLFLTLLTFLLAYLTIWLVFIARRPWLALVANSVVLLINLNQSTSDQFYFLIVFLVLTLLLLVRFALAENVRQWRHIGLRFSPDLSWDFMQAGAIFAVIVAVVPNLLPLAQPNQTLVSYFASDQSPITRVEQQLQNWFGGVNGKGNGTYSFFDNNLTLVGTVNLPDTPVLSYTLPYATQADSSQYLITEMFSRYDGTGTWQRASAIEQSYAANQTLPASTTDNHLDTYRITFLATPTGGQRYIFAPGSDAAMFNIASASLTSMNSHEPVAWLTQSSLQAGAAYTATGYVSSATIQQLQEVPYPGAAEASGNSSPYPPEILSEYLPQEEQIDPYIIARAQEVTAGATSMYAAAADIENYLRQNFIYNAHNPNPPANEDATVWFLKRKEGFCTFFASAMALMGRALGMPTRVVSGYATGSYDSRTNSFIVRGTQAHTWTQVYFAQYGWVNFEPTASFSPFVRALPSGPSANPTGSAGTPSATTTPALHSRGQSVGSSTPILGGSGDASLVNVGLGLGALALIILLIAGAVAIWWRSLFRGYTPIASGFARLALLGTLAGVKPKRSQTPREYASQLGDVAPIQREALEHVGASYSRERWGGPLPPSEVTRVSELYEHGRRALLNAIARRARQTPGRLLAHATRFSRASRAKQQPAERV